MSPQLTFRTIIPRNISLTLLTSLFVTAAYFVSGVLIARLLGAAGRGQLATCILWPSVIATVGSIGLKEAIVYHTAKEKRTSLLIPTALLLASGQSLFLVAIGFLVLPLLLANHDPSVLTNTKLFLLFIPLNLTGQYFIGIAEGHLKIRLVNLLRVIFPSVTLVVAILLYHWEISSVRLILIGHLLANLLVVVICAAVIIRAYSITCQLSPSLAVSLIKYGIRSHVGSVTGDFNQRLDQMLISAFLSSQFLGFYVVAVSVSGVIGIIPYAFQLILFPSAAGAGDLTKSKVIISRSFNRTMILVGFASLVLFFVIPYALPFFYGNVFEPAVIPCQILLLAAIFAAGRDILAFSHRALNNPFVASKSEILGFIVTATSLAALLPFIGITGAAVASVLAYGTACLYNLWKMSKLYGLTPSQLLGIPRAT